MKKLKPTQLRTIESNHQSIALENQIIECLKKDKKIIELKQELFKAQIALLGSEINKINQKIQTQDRVANKAKETSKEYIEKLKQQHNISSAFGYDPDTGEIREN